MKKANVIIFDVSEEYEAYFSGMKLTEFVNAEGNLPTLYSDRFSGKFAVPLGDVQECRTSHTPVTFFKNEHGVEVGVLYKQQLRETCGSPAYFLNQIADGERKNQLLTVAGDEQREQLAKAGKRIVTLEHNLKLEKLKNDRNFVERLVYLFLGY